MIALALSRVRSRRRRPPSSYRSLLRIVRALCLAWLARCVVFLAVGDLTGSFGLVFVALYLYATATERDVSRLEARGVILPPPRWPVWALLAFNVGCVVGVCA